jgi:hypothetical protein
MNRHMKSLLPLFLLACSLGAQATATVVNIDFSREPGTSGTNQGPTYNGLAAAPDAPTNTTWNAVVRDDSNSITANNLVDSSGIATTVDILISEGSAAQSIAGGSFSALDQELAAFPNFSDLMSDWVSLNSAAAGALGTATGTISGLASGQFYEIYFYGQGADNTPDDVTDGQNSFFAITSSLGGPIVGTGKQTGYDGTPGGNGVLTEGDEYVKFAAQADGSGNIYFLWQNVIPGNNVVSDSVQNSSNTGSAIGALNGIQIVQVVPEPSSALLALLGAFGLMARRRR